MFIVLMLNLLYGFAIYRHALTSHAFFIQQALLEEQSSRLAEQFRQAKEAEQALLDKNQFLTTASHDLRQPVRHGLSDRSHHPQKPRRQPDAPQLLDLQQSVRSVHLMFNSLLDLSKIESGNVRRHPCGYRRPARLGDHPVPRRGQQPRPGAAHWRPKRRISVMGDPLLVRQSLINLIQNALRYTQQGGVLIAIRPRGAECLVEVWDTGVGIADEEKSKIFSLTTAPSWRGKSTAPATGWGWRWWRAAPS